MLRRILTGLLALALLMPALPARGALADDLFAATTAEQYPTLQQGDQDSPDDKAYIVFIQNRLIQLGYLRDAADGVFGENTKNAVMAFQKSNGLLDTGIADAGTQALLFSDINKLVASEVDEGLAGSDTYRVQTMLAMWGFMNGDVDGQYGKSTSSAIQTFKQYVKDNQDPNYGITPTPSPSPTPEAHTYFGEMDVPPDVTVVPEITPKPLDGSIDYSLLEYVDGSKEFNVYRQTVQVGDKNFEARRVQNRLRHLKYLYSADGTFGEHSKLTLQYFQRRNGLPETGIADEATQRVLFSPRALSSDEYVFPYKLFVSIANQRVYVHEWNGNGYNDEPLYTVKCSTGTNNNPTPTGTYQAGGQSGMEWYLFEKSACYAKWAYHIVGNVLFHSVLYDLHKNLMESTVDALGHKDSHGCIRLAVPDAKWIYDNCPPGTTVVITED